jgi:hypothetical protein
MKFNLRIIVLWFTPRSQVGEHHSFGATRYPFTKLDDVAFQKTINFTPNELEYLSVKTL